MNWNNGRTVVLILAVSLGITIYYLITIAMKVETPEETAKRRLKKIEALGKTGQEAIKRTPGSYIRELAEMVIRLVAALIPVRPKERRKLQRQIVRCGLTMRPEELLARCLLSVSAGAVVGLYVKMVLGGSMIQMLVLGMAGGPLLLLLKLRGKAEARKREIEKDFPEILDLLRIAVEAGLGFGQALQDVVEQGKGVLIDELANVQSSMSMGATRKAAFKELADRCDVEDIRNFASSVVQSDELGIPIKNILDVQAQETREALWNRVETQVQKIPVKMVLPTAVFIFPATFLVILVPIALQSIDIFTSL